MTIQEREVVVPDTKVTEIIESDPFIKLKSAESRYLRSGKVVGAIPSHGSYPYVPRNPLEMIQGFLALRAMFKDPFNTFLDAGAGFGNILLIADLTKLAKHCVGLEIDETTMDISKRVVENRNRVELILGDIFIYKDYSKANIIYYFSPFSNWLLESYFEELVEDEASVGTIIIPRLKSSKAIDKDERFTQTVLEIKNSAINNGSHYPFYFYTKIKAGPREYSDLIEEKFDTYPFYFGKKASKKTTTWERIPEEYKKRLRKAVKYAENRKMKREKRNRK